MNFPILAGLLIATCALSSAAELSLTDLPATDERAFWTWNRTSFPLRNRNLSGGVIRIGRTQFPTGICGHTPFSSIYVLNGLAEAFEAQIGVEANDHPNDPILPGDPPPKITFRFLADFREVLKKECSLADPPFPIRINLRGVHHFEIQAKASGGRTSHRCRTALGNPRFLTGEAQKLKSLLQKTAVRKKEKIASFPAPPAWKRICIEKIHLPEGFGAYRIRTRCFELILATESGGRILHFSQPGGKNLLAHHTAPPQEKRLIRGAYPDTASGHFLRRLPPPAILPDDPILETAPYAVEFPEEGVILLRSGKSMVHEISAEFRLRILPDSVAVTNTIRNRSSFSRKLGVWCLTRVDTDALRLIRISGKETEQVILPETLNPELELKATGVLRLTAEFRDGTRFSIRTAEQDGLKFYRSAAFTELELLGPQAQLAPGESVSLTEIWTLSATSAEETAKERKE